MTSISYGKPVDNDANRFGVDFNKWKLDLEEIKTKSKCNETDIHAVLYTDGGCRPSPGGDAGWGIHGYLFTKDKPKGGHGCKTAIPHSAGYINLGDGKQEGSGSVPPITVLNYVDLKGGLAAPSSNNEAELLGLVDALDIVCNLKPASVKFLLDSKYVLDGCNDWLPRWVANNWVKSNGEQVSNKDTWLTVKGQLEEASKHTKLNWGWVKGHSDNMGNIIADSHATSGLYSIKNTGEKAWHSLGVSSTKNYWTPELDIHPLLVASCFYFRLGSSLTHMMLKGEKKYVYHIGTGGRKDDGKYFGKPDPETSYCTILVNDPLVPLEEVRKAQNMYSNVLNGGLVVLARLDNILSPTNLREINNHGSSILHGGNTGLNILNGRDDVLCRPLSPPRKSLEAADRIREQEMTLITALQSDTGFFVNNDITGLIYDWVEKKGDVNMVVKKELGGDDASIVIDVDVLIDGKYLKIPITLNFGIDAPRVPVFANIAKYKPIVTVITNCLPESSKAFRYRCLIELGTTKEYALWEAPYSNLRVII